LANVGLQYNLSKSTFAYAMVAQGKNTAGVLYSNGPTPTATGNVTGYAVGISHAF
jgi:predicted porin